MFTLQDWINERNAHRFAPHLTSCTTAETVASEESKAPSAEAILLTVDRLAKEPVLVGNLYGYSVYASREMAEGVVKVVEPETGRELLRFTVNNQYIEGTKIQKAARTALGI